MTSFPAAAQRVRDAGLPSRDRLLSLRECVLRFAPYGFRATWHHLLVTAPAPPSRDDDPLALRRAVDELEEARRVSMASHEDYAARRRREKAAGRRAAALADGWRCSGMIAYCPDFEKHPTDRLIVVVQRVIAAYESGVDASALCRACSRPLIVDAPCPGCGVDPRGPFARRPDSRIHEAQRWRAVWLRTRAPG